MRKLLRLGRFSLGVGDRFGRQAQAQLQACVMAAARGVEITPVWNKSNREHAIIGSLPAQTRHAAAAAVKSLRWTKDYFVDADHIGLKTVDRFVECSDFFTMDVADWIGRPAAPQDLQQFAARHQELLGRHDIPGLAAPLAITPSDVASAAAKYLRGVQEAGKIYRHIAQAKGAGEFIAEISMDETDEPQTPTELLIILAAIADEEIPAQTIAPKFIGRFNKGVEYVGDVALFERQFNDDLAIIAFAVKTYGLPDNLKLSVHSGSDKFSIYAPMRRAAARFDAGLHVKTAGTTWLEELIGLAECGGDALALAQEIYADSLDHAADLCAPYATVIDIDQSRLPSAAAVQQWTSEQYVSALRHERKNPAYNPHFRQLLHVGYKIAAQKGLRYLDLLDACRPAVSRNVTDNLFHRHIEPLFLAQD
ncbi:MAG TPA: tagaturonate epimerase family protein [Verrucomicrobiae bacterium]|jgi:hypothetical protein|nr:tagaturonate epimerase family protein [Verrucomicrobiae bacterium]